MSAADAGLSVKKSGDSDGRSTSRAGWPSSRRRAGASRSNAGEQATVKGDDRAEGRGAGVLGRLDRWHGGLSRRATACPVRHRHHLRRRHGRAGRSARRSRLEIRRQVVTRGGARRAEPRPRSTRRSSIRASATSRAGTGSPCPTRASVTGFAVETERQARRGRVHREERGRRAVHARPRRRVTRPRFSSGSTAAPTARASTRCQPAAPAGWCCATSSSTPDADGTLEYVYPMGAGDPVRIGEFSLSRRSGRRRQEDEDRDPGRCAHRGGRAAGDDAPLGLHAARGLPARGDGCPTSRRPLRVARFEAGGDSADYVMARYTPDVDWSARSSSREATSWWWSIPRRPVTRPAAS